MSAINERVFTIADELDAAGQRPTLDKIRDILGAGSFTTISKARKAWYAKKNAGDITPREPAPPLLTESLEQLASDVWGQALILANGRLSSEREALEKDRSEVEAECKEATEMADGLSLKLDAAVRDSSMLRDKVQNLETELSSVADSLRERDRDLAVAQARIEEVTKNTDHLKEQIRTAAAQNAELAKALSEKKSMQLANSGIQSGRNN